MILYVTFAILMGCYMSNECFMLPLDLIKSPTQYNPKEFIALIHIVGCESLLYITQHIVGRSLIEALT